MSNAFSGIRADLGSIPVDAPEADRMRALIETISAYIEYFHGGSVKMESYADGVLKIKMEVTALDDNRIQPTVPQATTLTDTQAPTDDTAATVPSEPTAPPVVKAFSATARAFEDYFENQVLAVVRKEAFAPTRRQFAALLQNQLRKSGELAFLDGKRFGGNREPLDDDDKFEINDWAEPSPLRQRFHRRTVHAGANRSRGENAGDDVG